MVPPTRPKSQATETSRPTYASIVRGSTGPIQLPATRVHHAGSTIKAMNVSKRQNLQDAPKIDENMPSQASETSRPTYASVVRGLAGTFELLATRVYYAGSTIKAMNVSKRQNLQDAPKTDKNMPSQATETSRPTYASILRGSTGPFELPATRVHHAGSMTKAMNLSKRLQDAPKTDKNMPQPTHASSMSRQLGPPPGPQLQPLPQNLRTALPTGQPSIAYADKYGLPRHPPSARAQRSPFLALPPEIRNMIYTYVLSIRATEVSKRGVVGIRHCCDEKGFKLCGGKVMNVNLLRTNRQISQEALPILYNNSFSIPRHQELYSFLLSVGRNIVTITRIRFSGAFPSDVRESSCPCDYPCSRLNADKTFGLLRFAERLRQIDFTNWWPKETGDYDFFGIHGPPGPPRLCSIIDGRGFARIVFQTTRAMMNEVRDRPHGFKYLFASMAERGSINLPGWHQDFERRFDGAQFMEEMDRLVENPDGMCMDVIDNEATILWTGLNVNEWRSPNRKDRPLRGFGRAYEWSCRDARATVLVGTRDLRRRMHGVEAL